MRRSFEFLRVGDRRKCLFESHRQSQWFTWIELIRASLKKACREKPAWELLFNFQVGKTFVLQLCNLYDTGSHQFNIWHEFFPVQMNGLASDVA